MTVNCQSIKSKEHLIFQNLQPENLDVLLCTETWITNKDEDWLACSVLNNGKYKMENIPRSERRGGGIAIMAQRRYCVMRIRTNKHKYFENVLWKVTGKNISLFILGIYHAPSSKNVSIQLSSLQTSS